MERLARLSIEGDRCFALVGDAEGEYSLTLARGPDRHFAEGHEGELGDLLGIVFDLAGGGKVLGQFAILLVDDLKIPVKGDRSDPRRTGVQGEDQVHRDRLTRAMGRFPALGWR
jgi:hypothetical protein